MCFFIGATTVTLTSNQPHVLGTFCRPGPVEFTCEGIDMTSGNLFWFVNGTLVANYGFLEGQTFPISLQIISPLDGVTAIIESARAHQKFFDITSIFSVNDVSTLNGLPLHCSDSRNMSEIIDISISGLCK